jgi:putative FmdB family regulatory protein
MPLYNYRCENCGKVFEKLVWLVEPVQAPVCPDCGYSSTRKNSYTNPADTETIEKTFDDTDDLCGSLGSFT